MLNHRVIVLTVNIGTMVLGRITADTDNTDIAIVITPLLMCHQLFWIAKQSRCVDIVSKVHIYCYFVNTIAASFISIYSAASAVLLVTHFMSLFAAIHCRLYTPTHMGLKNPFEGSF